MFIRKSSSQRRYALAFGAPRRNFRFKKKRADIKIKIIVHEAEEGGFWAEVPAMPGCATQGETMDELVRNVHDAIEGCLSVDM